jgi:hypothetical protein
MRDKPFKPETKVCNLTVLRLDGAVGVREADTYYCARFHCCDTEGRITHKRIKERIRDGARFCVPCSRKRGNRRPSIVLGSGYVGWAPPPSAMEK